ncbi:hypothetical protein JYU34_011630 [Plutella xylostella]|uniref:Uncharacterized protein n=1 Tax=Plutella xylostella TaxID=51655 RepID=A0ABQ7QDN4_PLUXY|nr:hypothetical protein JYU34_011630 [Plutella xylostella]
MRVDIIYDSSDNAPETEHKHSWLHAGQHERRAVSLGGRLLLQSERDGAPRDTSPGEATSSWN